MNIEKLAEKANKLLAERSLGKSEDKRASDSVSVRRIRDYISKGLLEKPIKIGKIADYNESHLNQLVSLRELQKDGLSESSIKKLSVPIENTVELTLKDSAKNVLNEIKNNLIQNNSFSALANVSGQSSLRATSSLLINNFYKDKSLTDLSLPKTKEFKEYPLNTEGTLFLKIENNVTIKDKDKAIELIKNILNIGEKND